MNPTRCVSSYFTTELLKYRNPEGGEENWLNRPEANPSVFLHRIVVAEIGVALLCVTATVESVAYGIFSICSLPLLVVSERPFKWSVQLLESSGFTLYWNFGNLLVFNLFCRNVFTDESFARYSIDHLPRGDVYRVVLIAVEIGLVALSIFNRNFHYQHLELNLFKSCLRSQDLIYIADWLMTHPNNHHHGMNNIPLHEVVHDPQINQLRGMANEVNQLITEGATFFKECILNPEQIDEEAKTQVLEFDPNSYIFVLTRSVYLYVFGSKKHAQVPSFFKLETRLLILQLREKYEHLDKEEELKSLMQNLLAFNQDPQNDQIKALLNDLKEAAYTELQNSLFITKCWEKACQEFIQNEA